MTAESALAEAGALGRRFGLGIPGRLRDLDVGFWDDLFHATVGPVLEEGVEFPALDQSEAHLEAQIAFIGANLLSCNLSQHIAAKRVLAGDPERILRLLRVYADIANILTDKENSRPRPKARQPPLRSVLYSPRTALRRGARQRQEKDPLRQPGPSAAQLNASAGKLRLQRIVLKEIVKGLPVTLQRSHFT